MHTTKMAALPNCGPGKGLGLPGKSTPLAQSCTEQPTEVVRAQFTCV